MRGIQEEPAFAWWVTYTMKKRKTIIQKVRSKYWQKTHKYGIRIPKTVAEAKSIDKENGDTMWMDAVRLEMKNVRIAFKEYDGNPRVRKGGHTILSGTHRGAKVGDRIGTSRHTIGSEPIVPVSSSTTGGAFVHSQIMC